MDDNAKSYSLRHQVRGIFFISNFFSFPQTNTPSHTKWTIPTLILNGNSETIKYVSNKSNSIIRNDILRAKGILPPKDEDKDDKLEDAFVDMVRARQEKLDSLDNKDLDELDELEDLEDDQILNQYR